MFLFINQRSRNKTSGKRFDFYTAAPNSTEIPLCYAFLCIKLNLKNVINATPNLYSRKPNTRKDSVSNSSWFVPYFSFHCLESMNLTTVVICCVEISPKRFHSRPKADHTSNHNTSLHFITIHHHKIITFLSETVYKFDTAPTFSGMFFPPSTELPDSVQVSSVRNKPPNKHLHLLQIYCKISYRCWHEDARRSLQEAKDSRSL